MSDLQSFHLFMSLPSEIRVEIWLLLMPRNQVIHVQEQLEFYYSESEVLAAEAGHDESENEDESEHDRIVRLIDRECEKSEVPRLPWNLTIDLFSGPLPQTQLERFGFTSSRSPAALLRSFEVEAARWHWWDRNRVGCFVTNHTRVPVLLLVCHETRRLMQRQGLVFAFSTKTDYPMMWFNFSHDFLHLEYVHDREAASTSIDMGYWNIGQIGPKDRAQLKKLSLEFCHTRYVYGGQVPSEIHMAVQICGNLTELLLVEDKFYNLYDESGRVSAAGSAVAVDISAEDLLGHIPNWKPERKYREQDGEWSLQYRKFQEDFVKDHEDPLKTACRDIEYQIRNYMPLLPQEDGSRNTWTTPKIRFVTLMSQKDADGLADSRRYFCTDVQDWFQNRTITAIPSHRLQDKSLCNDLARNEYYHFQRPGWLQDAQALVYTKIGWPSPFTVEMREAKFAMEEMDNWDPWGG